MCSETIMRYIAGTGMIISYVGLGYVYIKLGLLIYKVLTTM